MQGHERKLQRLTGALQSRRLIMSWEDYEVRGISTNCSRTLLFILLTHKAATTSRHRRWT